MDAQGQDSGTWRCHVKKDIRSHLFSEAFINLDVATPYSLNVDVPSNVIFMQRKASLMPINSNTTASENLQEDSIASDYENHHASCSASSLDRHGGGIEPQLTWFVNGIQVKNMTEEMIQKLVSFSLRFLFIYLNFYIYFLKE